MSFIINNFGDTVPDAQDNCPDIYNPSHTDSDDDQIANACDDDCPNLAGSNPVNLADYSILADNWKLAVVRLPADLNSDNVVDARDLAIPSLYWLSKTGQRPASPESPTSTF